MIYRVDHLITEFIDDDGKPAEGPSEMLANKHILQKFLHSARSRKLVGLNRKTTIEAVAASVTPDIVLVQCIGLLGDIRKSQRIISAHVRELVGFVHPAASKSAGLQELVKLSRKTKPGPFGAKLDDAALKRGAEALSGLVDAENEVLKHITTEMQKLLPNVTAVAGVEIGAGLLAMAGSLERLARLPASTIQVLGAEKAFFRHLTAGTKSPKHGILFYHDLVQKAKRKDKGKVARTVAEKISIVARVDFFKGEFVGEKIRKGLEKRW